MYDPEQITFFAKTDARGQQVPFGIKANDRTRHVYVIGKTGMGKSTLLENMAAQDLKNGNGLAFIDPHGQTAETLLDYIPEERKDDVLYFAPFDTDNPISFNVMEDVGPDKRHLVVAGLMSVFKKIWVDAWSARMEYILSNTLLALLEYPDSTLLGVNRMLSDKDYRMRVIENITDPAVKSFWVDEFLKYNERYMQEAGDAIKNKIGQFTSNPLIRNIIGQPHTSFNIREIMDERKIMIINLSKGLVGEQNANLLGSMMTTRIYLAAMSRADLTGEQLKAMPNFYFYVDEFQSFANATFADILSEARKYKLNLTIAHQYVAQMEDEVRDAVFGNVGTIISFRVGPFDAEVLETVFTPKFLAPDIVNLGFAQIYLTLMIDGIGSTPFSAVTLPPIETPPNPSRDAVISSSRKNFSKQRDGVQEDIHAWHDKSFSDKPPYIPKHLREKANGGDLPNTGENLKKYGVDGVAPKAEQDTSVEAGQSSDADKKGAPDAGRNNNNRNNGGQGRPMRSSHGGGGKPAGNASRAHVRPDAANRSVTTYSNGNSGTQNRDVRNEKNGSDPRTTQRPQQNKNSSQQNGNRSEQKGKSMDELRSILKGISSGNEKEKEVAAEKKETKKQEDLKGALAAALGGVAGVTVSPKHEEKKESVIQKASTEEKTATDTSSPEQKNVDTSVLVQPKEEVVHVEVPGKSGDVAVDRSLNIKQEAEESVQNSEKLREQSDTPQKQDVANGPRNGDDSGQGKKRKRRRKKKESGDHEARVADEQVQERQQSQQNNTRNENIRQESVPEAVKKEETPSKRTEENNSERKDQNYDPRAMQSEEKSVDTPPAQNAGRNTSTTQKQTEQAAPVATENKNEAAVIDGRQDTQKENGTKQQVQKEDRPQESQQQMQAAPQQKQAPVVEPQVAVVQQQTSPEVAVQAQVATPTQTTQVSTRRSTFSQNNEYALLKNKATVDPLAPKKLERMMKVTTSDKLPLK